MNTDNCRALFGEDIRLITYTRPRRNPGSMFPSKVFYHAMILPDYMLSLKGGKEDAFLGPSTAITREGAIVSLLLDSEKMIGSVLLGEEEEEGGEEEAGDGGGQDKEEQKAEQKDAPASWPLRGWERFTSRERGDREITPQSQSIATTQNAEDLPGSRMQRDMRIGGVRGDRARPVGEGRVVETHAMLDGCVVGDKPASIGSSGSPSVHPPVAVQDHATVRLLIPIFEETRGEPARPISPARPWNSLQPGSWDWGNLGTAPATAAEGPASREGDGRQDWAKREAPGPRFSSGLPPTAGEDYTQSSYRSSGSATAHDGAAAEEGYESEFSQTTPSTFRQVMTPCSSTPTRGYLGPGEATEKDFSRANRDLVKSEVALAVKGLLKAMARQVESTPVSPDWGLL